MSGRQTGRRLGGIWILAACVLWSGSAGALTDEEVFRDFRFNFLNPGARSLGMGGAFVAIANDASAAQANPAGLHYVTQPEVFVEFRSVSDDTQVFRSDLGSLSVDPLTGARELPFLSLTSVSEPDSLSEPSFVSFVWPSSLRGKSLTIAASRHVLLSQDRTLESSPDRTEARFAFESFPNTVSGGEVQAYSVSTPVTGSSSAEIVYWNLAASYGIHPDFSLGLVLSAAELDFEADTLTEVIDPLALFVDPSHPRLPARPTTDLYRTRVDDSDSDLAFAVGIHWHPDSVFASGESSWRFGAVYRKGASFDVRETTVLNDTPDRTFETPVVVPDRYSVGAMYRPRDDWTFSLEFERIEYSDMLEGFESGVNYLTGGRVAGDAFGVDPDVSVLFDADDGTVPRLGAEHTRPFGSDRLLSLRLGYYRNADGRIRMSRFNSDDPDVNAVYLDAFRGGDDEDHLTAGVGFRFGRSTVHAAGDFSDEGNQVLASFTYRLGSR